MATYIFITIYFFVYLLTTSSSFHLKGVADENAEQIHHNSSQVIEFENFISPAQDAKLQETHSNETQLRNFTLPVSVGKSENKTADNSIHAEKSDNVAQKICGKDESRMTKLFKSTEKPLISKYSNKRNSVIHPKRDSFNHQDYKNSKDWHKTGAVNYVRKDRGIDGFDVIIVDLQPTYTKRRDTRRLYTRSTSPIQYVPETSSSIFDLFFTSTLFDQPIFNEPLALEMENDFYLQEDFPITSWNQHPSLNSMKIVRKPDIFPQQQFSEHKNQNVSSTTLLNGRKQNIATNCTCGGMK